MRIQSSQIAMSAEQSQSSTLSTKVEGKVWVGSVRPRDTVQISELARDRAGAQLSIGIQSSTLKSESLRLVSAARQHQGANEGRLYGTSSASATHRHHDGATQTPVGPPEQETSNGTNVGEVTDEDLMGSPDGGKLLVLKRLLEAMTGQSVRIGRIANPKGNATPDSDAKLQQVDAAPQQRSGNGNGNGNGQVGWGLELDIERVNTETQRSSFEAQGSIVTEDGRRLTFSASFLKESQTVSVERLSLREGDAKMKDPLVLVFSGNSAELTKNAAAFDLDNDGNLDRLPGIANGAYVVADKNHDGKVNDASELLGALSNDGFADLRALDLDRNGFVDEADSGYKDLYLWAPTTTPESSLTSLSAAGIGALYTGQVASPLEIRDAMGNLEGKVRSSGLAITETGGTRLLEQLDLTQAPNAAQAPQTVSLKA